jgi:hypothetical protein
MPNTRRLETGDLRQELHGSGLMTHVLLLVEGLGKSSSKLWKIPGLRHNVVFTNQPAVFKALACPQFLRFLFAAFYPTPNRIFHLLNKVLSTPSTSLNTKTTNLINI